ncbi:MAG: crossover junction endodeoxyribonuclease RuvC [Candidatus Omnitrophica bacterium]|nr:crossover junction endodeoxyribonuclease RuvC [Candidatus Omnitrophota bacterium]
MVILGVDAGLQANGVAVVESKASSFDIKYLGEIKTKASCPLSERFFLIFSSLEKIIDEFEPSVLVLEKIYSHYRHPTTAAVLGGVRGVVMLLGAIKNMKIVEYPVTHVKKSVTSYGTASKDQMKRMVSYLAKLQKPLKSQHLADALALVMAYLHTQR